MVSDQLPAPDNLEAGGPQNGNGVSPSPSPSPTVVRNATLADAEIITEFNMHIAKESEDLDLDRNVLKAGVKALLSDKTKGTYFVATTTPTMAGAGDSQENVVIGQLMITYEWSDWKNAQIWWIQSVYVAPEYRRAGVFKGLYAHVSKIARDAGACGLRLYADVGNKKAHAAYEKMGMTSHYIVYEDMWKSS